MWVLESLSKVVVAGPFKSEAEMARKLGVSQQFVNRQIRNSNHLFHLDGEKVLARQTPACLAGTKRFWEKENMAKFLGVPQEVVEKVFRKKTSGIIQTPQGEVKIQKLRPGEKPTLPAVRVLWDDDTEKQDFVSFAAAARELKIDPKTIPHAIKAGRDSFTRKSDGKKFTFEIPEENTPSRKKPKPPSEETKAKWAEVKRQQAKKGEILELYKKRRFSAEPKTFEDKERFLEAFYPEELAKIREKELTSEEKPPEEKK